MKHILVPMDLLSELAESLACELDARYPACIRFYESQDRRYQAEMEPVLTARQIIAAAPAVEKLFMADCKTQSDREAWLATLFPEDRMFEEIKSMASETYRRHRSSARGQQISVADEMESHLIWATKRWIELNEPAPSTSPAEQQPSHDSQ